MHARSTRHQPPCKHLSTPLLTTPATCVPALIASALPVNMLLAKVLHTQSLTHMRDTCNHTLQCVACRYHTIVVNTHCTQRAPNTPTPAPHYNTHSISQYCTVRNQRQAGTTHMFLAARAGPAGASRLKKSRDLQMLNLRTSCWQGSC
jgi:hypothetical protein